MCDAMCILLQLIGLCYVSCLMVAKSKGGGAKTNNGSSSRDLRLKRQNPKARYLRDLVQLARLDSQFLFRQIGSIQENIDPRSPLETRPHRVDPATVDSSAALYVRAV